MSETDYVQFSVKVKKSVAQKLRDFSKARGENLSTVIRRNVRRELARHSYLSDDEKKALEVGEDE